MTTSIYVMGDRSTEVSHPTSGVICFTYEGVSNVPAWSTVHQCYKATRLADRWRIPTTMTTSSVWPRLQAPIREQTARRQATPMQCAHDEQSTLHSSTKDPKSQ
jgi:hypothetical protein